MDDGSVSTPVLRGAPSVQPWREACSGKAAMKLLRLLMPLLGTAAGCNAQVPSSPEEAAVPEEVRALGAHLPGGIFLGTSSWTFPGWAGLVFDREVAQAKLTHEGLAAYAQHPILRTVGIDRTFYGPVETATFAEWAGSVPEGFRFLVKAHEFCTLARFPQHARYGARRGLPNDAFLDPAYAAEAVVAPFVEGLGAKAGPLVFQFPPQDVALLGGPDGLADRLHRFLSALPRGPLYAVELRNGELLTDRMAEALAACDAAPVIAIWSHLPSPSVQARLTRALAARALVVRWMLPPHVGYDEAKARYEPFNKLVEEDVSTRESLAKLVTQAHLLGKPSFVTINNKAEGSSPLSAIKLAESIVLERAVSGRSAGSGPP